MTFSPAKICSSKILKKEEHPDCHTVLRFHVNYYTSEFDTYSTLHYGFWEEPKFGGANSHWNIRDDKTTSHLFQFSSVRKYSVI